MQGMYACRSAPKLRSREASARKQVKPEAPTPDAFGIARAKPKYGTPSGVSAGSCCPHHIAARRISKQLEETQAVFFYACVSFFPQNSLRDFCGSPEIIPQNSLRDFCGSLEIIPQNSLRDFCGSPEIIPQNSLRDFCGSPENERHGWRSFFCAARMGRQARADITTPPSCLWQATVSAAQGKRRLGQEISPQWEISKLAGGQRAHLVAARRFGLRRASFAA